MYAAPIYCNPTLHKMDVVTMTNIIHNSDFLCSKFIGVRTRYALAWHHASRLLFLGTHE